MEDNLKRMAELTEMLEEFVSISRSKVTDSNTVKRKPVFASDKNICDLAFGDAGDETIVKPNPFNATIVVVEGSAKIDFDDGCCYVIDEKNRNLSIPKNTGFTVTAKHKGSAILTILDRL